MNNILKILALGCIAFMSCKTEAPKQEINNSYELSINDNKVPIGGIDYTLTDNGSFPEESTAYYQSNDSIIRLTLTKPESDIEPILITYAGNEIYAGDGKDIELAISDEEAQMYVINTGYRKPLRFFVKYYKENIEVETSLNSEDVANKSNNDSHTSEETNSNSENLATTAYNDSQTSEITVNEQAGNISNEKSNRSQGSTGRTQSNEKISQDVGTSSITTSSSTKKEIINIEFANDPTYELVNIQVDGKDVSMYRKKKKITAPKPPKSTSSKRLKNLNTISNNSDNCPNGDVRKGPFNFTITPKTPIELKYLKVLGISSWDAKVSIKGPGVKVEITNEQIVPSNCEVSLSSKQKLLPNKTYTISISSITKSASLVDLANCNGFIKSNKHMIISGSGANVVHSLSYKH